MDNLDLLSNYNISEHWEEGEDRRKCSCAIHDQEWNMVDFEPVREIAYSGPFIVGMRYDNDFVTPINKLGR